MGRRGLLPTALIASLFIPCCLAASPSATFTVTNTGAPVWQGVALLPVGEERLRDTASVREGNAPVAWQRTEKGILALLPGVTQPGAKRSLSVTAEKPTAQPRTDLAVSDTATAIVVSNLYFRIEHPRRGNGGFPVSIRFNQSGVVDKGFVFEDRLFSKERGYKAWHSDGQASARVVESGPVQVVVEAQARATDVPGNPRATYRYRYRAFSPVVEVTARVERDDDHAWSELHFLQISRKDNVYGRWAGGNPVRTGAFTDSGKGDTFRRWAMMANEEDAVGLGVDGTVSFFDGISEYYNYLQLVTGPLTARSADLRGSLYLGPARAPERIRDWLMGGAALAAEPAPTGPDRGAAAAQPVALDNGAISIGFAKSGQGMGATSLFSQRTRREFLTQPAGKPLVWRLVLKGPDAPEIRVDNTAVATCSATEVPTKGGRAIDLVWDHLAAGDEADVLKVKVRVELPKGSETSLWSIDVTNRSKRYGLWEVHFPLFAALSERGLPDVAVPRSNWGMLYRGSRGTLGGSYPSADWPMQFLLLNEGEHGLYLAAHDAGAWPKRFSLTSGGEFYFNTPVENMGVAGSSFHAPFPFAVGIYRGDWWQGAKRYREWALRQPWTARGPVAARTDTPERMKRLGIWMLANGTREEVVPRMLEAKRLFGVPVGVHWYSWHQIPFDVHYPDYFPTKPGFAEGARALDKESIIAMPYINGRLWDTANENFAVGRPGACKQPDGAATYIEQYGSGAKLAPMCPATQVWQDKVNEVVGRLIRECGVNAIYLDQIGAAAPALCFDKSHGHPLGGGHHWVDGYRDLLRRVRAQTAGRVGITTENNAEPYMDNVDAFLIWNPRHEAEIPMMTAVYSGYSLYFSSPARTMDPLAFRMLQGRDFVWGCQPGWMGFELLEPANRENAEYLRELARYRALAYDFVVTGELAGELHPVTAPPALETTWAAWKGTWPAALPAVVGTVWRAHDGRVALLLANLSDTPQRFSFRFEPGAWGLSGAGRWTIRRLTPGTGSAPTATPVALVSATDASVAQGLGPREIRMLDLVPSTAAQVAAVKAQMGRTEPERELPAADALLRTDVRFQTPPRAGEQSVLQVRVWGGSQPVTDVRLAIDLPAGWDLEPGRTLMIDRLEPGEERLFPLLCSVPGGASGSVFVRANVVSLQPGRRFPIAPGRPSANACHFAQPPVIDGDLSEWADAPTLLVDGAVSSKVKAWKGPADLSGKVRAGWDAERLYLAFEVADDAFEQAGRDKDIWRGDCVQVALRPGGPADTSGYEDVYEFGLALTPGGPQIWKWLPDEHNATGGTLAAKRTAAGLVYEAAIPWAEVGRFVPTPRGCMGFSFTLNDADGTGFRGWMEWTPGVCGNKDAASFGRLVF